MTDMAGPDYRPRHAHSARRKGVPRRAARRWAIGLAALLVIGVAGTALALWLEGYRAHVIHTGSMEPGYRPGDLVIDRAPTGHYHRGDVITFRHSSRSDDVVTHRVTSVTATGLIHTKGDANRTADVWDIRPEQVQGESAMTLRGAGYLVVFFQQPTGVAALATSVLALVLLWQLFFADDREAGESAGTGPSPRRRPCASPA